MEKQVDTIKETSSERHELFQIIAEQTLDTIVIIDTGSVVKFVSPSFEHVTGYSLEQYEGMDAFEVIYPEDRERVRAINAEVVRTKTERDLEYRVLHASGETRFVETRVRPVLDQEGHVKYVVAVVRDITKRKQTERLLNNILQNINAAVISTDRYFSTYSYCSDSIERVAGIPWEEAIQNPHRLHDHIHPEDTKMLIGEVRSQLNAGQPVNVSVRMTHVKGEERWNQVIFHPFINHAGEVERLDGIFMDITEKRRSELALEESVERYKSLFENNLDGVFSIELTGLRFVNVNPVFETITGLESARIAERSILDIIFNEDQETVNKALIEVMRHGKPKDIECRLVPEIKGEKIVSITFVPIFLSGKLNGIHGILKDITVRKREERELIESEKRYKFLQQSLHRFSNELSDIMKVSELEDRLIHVIRNVLPVTDAAIEEIERGEEDALQGSEQTRIRIGEKKHPVFLRISLRQPLLRIEEEWLENAVHYVTILYDNLHIIEDLMKRLEQLVTANETPKWILRLLFRMSEKERATLSSDLHDTVLQDLIFLYRKLELHRSSRTKTADSQEEDILKQTEEGLLDAIHQIRVTCNELRPPFLIKMGIVDSLKSLFEYTRMFSNYEIEFSAERSYAHMSEEQILGIYRITQELLNNANKHSKANTVRIACKAQDNDFLFTYSDDGVGMDLSGWGGSYQHMGISGIEKRIQSLDGTFELQSAPDQGFHVTIQFPIRLRS